MKKKGFTIIELLAVIIIIGVVTAIGVIAIGRYMDKAEKDTYLSNLKTFTKAARDMYNADRIPQEPKSNEALVIPVSVLDIDESVGYKSPYGEYILEMTYVILVKEADEKTYYIVALDTGNAGINGIAESKLHVNHLLIEDDGIYDIKSLAQIEFEDAVITLGGRKYKYDPIRNQNSAISTLILKEVEENSDFEYVKSGLTLHYDGIKNAASGHDNAATSWYDLSGENNNTTAGHGTIAWDENSFIGNNSNSGFSLPDTLTSVINSRNFTIEITFKASLPNDRDILIGNYNTNPSFNIERNSSAFTDTSSRFYWNNGSPDIKLVNAVTTNKNTLTVSLNGTNVKSYLDGILKDNITNASIGAISPSGLYLGRDTRTGVTVFGGNIYSVRIYNRVLTLSEIEANVQIDKERFGF